VTRKPDMSATNAQEHTNLGTFWNYLAQKDNWTHRGTSRVPKFEPTWMATRSPFTTFVVSSWIEFSFTRGVIVAPM
jgi:hypothetical protein